MNTHIPEEYGGPGPRLPLRLHDRGGDGLGLLGHRHARSCATAWPPRRSCIGGSEETKKKYLGHAHRGAEARVVLPDRAGRRLRRLGHADHRRQAGRQVHPQRLEVLHHQRRLRRLLHGLREDRQGRGPQGHLARSSSSASGRRRGRQEGGQARTARLQHRDDLVQRRRGPGREPARRGEPRASSSR